MQTKTSSSALSMALVRRLKRLRRPSATLQACGLMVLLGEHGADRGRDHGALARPDVGQQIAEDVNPAALPGGVQHLGSSGFQPFVRVRDHELDTAQPAPHERTQEGGPERLGLGRPDRQAENEVRVSASRSRRGGSVKLDATWR